MALAEGNTKQILAYEHDYSKGTLDSCASARANRQHIHGLDKYDLRVDKG